MTNSSRAAQVDRAALRATALAALAGTSTRVQPPHTPLTTEWQLQDSNSFRRIGTPFSDGDVLCGTRHPRDGQPDLLAASGVLDYIVAAQPLVMIRLLEDLDAADDRLRRTRCFAETLLALTTRVALSLAALSKEDGSEMHAVVRQLRAALEVASR
jgi:hypothetical protein